MLSKGKKDIISLSDPIYNKDEVVEEDERLTSSASHVRTLPPSLPPSFPLSIFIVSLFSP